MHLLKLSFLFLILISTNLLALTDDEAMLFSAVQNGDTETIKLLILSSVDVNIVDEAGYTPLHIAVLYNELESVNELLAYVRTDREARLPKDAIIDTWYLSGATPLILASYLGHTDIVESLIEYNADIKARDSVDGAVAIHIAAANGHLDIVKMFTALDESLIRITDDDGSNALHWASMNEYPDVIIFFIRNGVSVNLEDFTGASSIDYLKNVYSDDKILEMLKDAGYSEDESQAMLFGDTESTQVAKSLTEEAEVTEELIEVPTSIDSTSIIEPTPSVEVLTPTDTDTDTNLMTKSTNNLGNELLDSSFKNFEITVAAKYGDVITINRLMKEGVNPNFVLKNGYTPLHAAIYGSKVESFKKLLLYEDIDIEIMGSILEIYDWDFGYFTPLFLASILGNDEIVSLLLENNANIFYKNDATGILSIHVASYYNYPNIVDMFIKKDSSVINAYSDDKRTPLHYAVIAGAYEIVYMLLSYGADYNLIDIHGRTSLHYAVATNNLDMVKELVGLGGDKNIKDNEGNTPYLLAVRLDYEGIIEFLEDEDEKDNSMKWWRI